MRRQNLERTILRRSEVPAAVPGPAGELWLVVAELPDRQREAVVLRHVAQLTEPEIAAVMGVARGTVSSTLRAAHARLRTELDDSEPPEPTTATADSAPPSHPLERKLS